MRIIKKITQQHTFHGISRLETMQLASDLRKKLGVSGNDSEAPVSE